MSSEVGYIVGWVRQRRCLRGGEEFSRRRRVVLYTISAAVADMSSLRVVRIPRRTNGRTSIHESGWGCAFRVALGWWWKRSLVWGW